MERQRSFSVKSTRFLALSFTISSSFIFLAFVFVWFVKSNPPAFHQETHFQVNANSSLTLTLNPITVHTLTGFGRNFSATDVERKNPILSDTQFNTSKDTSGFHDFSVTRETQKEKNHTKALDGTKGKNIITHQEAALPSPPPPLGKSEKKKMEEGSGSVRSMELPSSKHVEKKKKSKEKKDRECDFTNGRWVYDDSYPLYTNGSCRFVDEGFNCMSNGRPDNDYTKWKWQPHDCDLPRYLSSLLLFIFIFSKVKLFGFCLVFLLKLQLWVGIAIKTSFVTLTLLLSVFLRFVLDGFE